MPSWDIKILKVSLNGEEDEEDCRGFLEVEKFGDKCVSFYLNGKENGEVEQHIENISIDSARRIRDFLIYSLQE